MIRPRPGEPPHPHTADALAPSWGLGDVVGGLVAAQVLSVVAVGIAVGASGWGSVEEFPLWAVALVQVPLWSGLLAGVLWAGRKGDGVVRDFGFAARWFDPLWGVSVGLVTQVVVLPLLYLPLLELWGRTSDDLARPARDLADRAEGPAGWAVLVLVVVVCAPVVEELFYRGLLLRSLQKRGWPAWAAVVVSAAVFAASHFQALQFPGLFVFGLILALMTVGSGRLGPAIWAHVAFNSTTVVSLYLSSF